MPKDNLRDKLEGNELDLSLNNLDTVPVKELAAIPKATRLDLSCNQLSTLPDNFGTLTHLTKIDLSKNRLTELPDNFGNLHSLQHLDLLGNQLVILPVSFYKLTKLKWLDLKDNPLQEDLKKYAGDCLDEAECKKCAQKVLQYLKECASALERMKQKKLREEREEKKRLEAIQEAEKERVRKERKIQKEANRRKREQANAKTSENNKAKVTDITHKEERNGKPSTTGKKKGSYIPRWLMILCILVGILAFAMGPAFFICHNKDNKDNSYCSTVGNLSMTCLEKLFNNSKAFIPGMFYEHAKMMKENQTSTASDTTNAKMMKENQTSTASDTTNSTDKQTTVT